LRASLEAATSLYCPDTERATAGIHFAKVLTALDLHDAVAARLRTYPDGATAMRELAQSVEPWPLGCTQVTEILYTPGVRLVGPLPAEFELATVYAIAVAADSPHPDLARSFAALLAGPAAKLLREHGGFEA
jgi:molybdate transport system substrate-binding protein